MLLERSGHAHGHVAFALFGLLDAVESSELVGGGFKALLLQNVLASLVLLLFKDLVKLVYSSAFERVLVCKLD